VILGVFCANREKENRKKESMENMGFMVSSVGLREPKIKF